MKALALLVTGVLVSSLGTGMTAFALGIHIYQKHGTATAVSLAQLCTFAPLVLLAPLAGVLADRFDRRTMMILGDGGSVLGLGVVLLALRTNTSTIILLIGVALASVFASLTEPALRASVTDLVDEENYVRASGLLQLASVAKYLVAPATAGFLLTVTETSTIIAIDAATCLVMVALTWAIRRMVGHRTTCQAPATLRTRLTEGLAAITASATVRNLIILMSFVTLAVGVLQALFKPILLPIASPQAVGIIETVAAIGLLVGSAIVSALHLAAPARLLKIGLTGAGVAMLALGLLASQYWITGCSFAFFSLLPLANAGADALVRLEIPNQVQARAWGLIFLLSQVGYLIAFALAGPIADLLDAHTETGRGAALLVSAMGTLVIVVGLLTVKFLPTPTTKDAR